MELLILISNYKNMGKEGLTIEAQITEALDGRTQRWLSFEVRIAEQELSKKMNGRVEFTEAELQAIEERLNFKISK